MNSYYVFLSITLTTSLLPVLTGGFVFKALDKASKVLYALFVFDLITELAAFYAAKRYHNNFPVYNIASLIQVMVICCYFNYCITAFRKRSIGFYLGVASIILGILNILFLQPVNTYNTYYFLYQTVLIFLLGAAFCMQFLSPEYCRVEFNHHFWFVLLMILYYVMNYFSVSLYLYFTSRLKDHGVLIDNSIVCLNALINTGFAIVFIFYPKMKIRNAR